MARFDLSLEHLRDYVAPLVEPADFDSFWHDTVAAARAVGTPVSRRAVASPLTLVDVFDVTFPGFGGDPVCAWLVLPRHRDEPVPAVVEFVGYGRGRGLAHERLHWPVAGFAQLIVDTRGQGATWGTGGSTPDPHGSGPATAGFLTRGIDDPATYYYRRVFTDAVRAIDALRGFSEIDPDRIAVTGNSQGGLIAIAAAALADRVAAALPTAPILCDIPRVIGLTDADPHAEISRYLAVHRDAADRVFATLAYFDGAILAARATAPTLFGCGHMDTIAPPSGVYAAFNRWGGTDREMADYPWNHHEGGEGRHWLRQVAWLTRRLMPDAAPASTGASAGTPAGTGAEARS